jgi:5'(3')-deoxyribonucleotidase
MTPILRIGVDVDGVLADFNAGFIDRVIHVTGRDLFPARPFDIPTWNYPEHYGYTGAEVSAVWEDIKADPWFWRNLPAYPHTTQALGLLMEAMRMGHFVYFITARPGVLAKQQTEEWIDTQYKRMVLGAPHATVLISSHKGLCAKGLDLDFYIDDRLENVLDVINTRVQCETFLLDRPWNRDGSLARDLEDRRVVTVATALGLVLPSGPSIARVAA